MYAVKKWKSSKSARGFHQALDLAIAYYIESLQGEGEVNIITQENQFPMYNKNDQNRFVLEVFGFTIGKISVPVKDEQIFLQALQKMRFENLSLLHRFFLREKIGNFEKISVYRINDIDRNQITTGYF